MKNVEKSIGPDTDPWTISDDSDRASASAQFGSCRWISGESSHALIISNSHWHQHVSIASPKAMRVEFYEIIWTRPPLQRYPRRCIRMVTANCASLMNSLISEDSQVNSITCKTWSTIFGLFYSFAQCTCKLEIRLCNNSVSEFRM